MKTKMQNLKKIVELLKKNPKFEKNSEIIDKNAKFEKN